MKTVNLGQKTKVIVKIVLKSSIFAIALLFIWYYLFRQNFKENPESDEIIGGVMNSFLIFSVIFPALILTKIFQETPESSVPGVPPMIYLAIIVVSLLAILSLMMVPYHRIEVGIFAVGGLGFIHGLFFFITREMDNPSNPNT